MGIFDNAVGATFSHKGVEYNSSCIKSVGPIESNPPFSWTVYFTDGTSQKLLPEYTAKGTLREDRDEFVISWHNSMI
jgi:hypothetical protein